MENKNIKTINTVGKIGRILSMILIVLMILAGIATLGGTIFAGTMPKEDINVTVNGTADISTSGTLFEKFKDVIDLSQEGDGATLAFKEDVEGANIIIADDNDILEGATLSETEKGYAVDFNAKTITFSLGRVIWGLVSTLIYVICIIVTLFMLRNLFKALEKCATPFCDDVIRRMKSFGFSLIPFVVLKSVVDTAWGSIVSTGFNGSINLDFTMVIAILIVFMLAMIFGYGAELQQQSDETL